MKTPVIASIGMTHPWNIAGVGLDAQVAREYGVRIGSVIVGITAQDERGLHAVFAVPTEIVQAQLAALPREVDALRIGALPNVASVLVIADFLESRPAIPAVLDPVFAASLGGEFSNDETIAAFRERMLKPSVVLTPNLSEAGRLLDRSISTVEEMIDAARALRGLGAGNVVIKGGHLCDAPTDVLVDRNGDVKTFQDVRLCGPMRGSGCTLAAALACERARGRAIVPSVESARAYVRAKIAARTYFGTLQVAF